MSFRIGSYESDGGPDHGAGRRNRSSHDEEDAPGYKRQRTALACNSCRFRKSRCNGARPVCSTCTDMGFECVYRGPAPAIRHQTREMQAMENRLHKFEELLLSIATKVQNSDNVPTAMPSASQLNGSNFSGGPAAQDNSTFPYSNLNGFQQEQARTQREEPMSGVTQDDTVDGMGSIIFADESSSGFFGPSSNSAFFSNIAVALTSRTGTMPEGKEFSRDLAANMSRPPSPPLQSRPDPTSVNPYKLPSRTEILRLIEIFFSFTGQFFPYISKSNLTHSVNELNLVRFAGVRKSWLCLLNAVMAMATSLDGESGRHVKSRESESDVFFQRALILSPWTISNTANLETLQALTVMTQYLQGTSRSAQTWRLHGLLVQAAFQIGVHTKDPNSKISAFEQEIRTRTWYTCIVLDRIFSTTFGRPPLIHNELIQIEMPLPVDLDRLPKDRPHFEVPENPPEPIPSSCVIFTTSIKLYCIQGDIIRTLYNHNMISSHHLRSDELFSKTIELDHELTQWKRNLPPSAVLLPLEFVEGMDPENWVYTKNQTVLTLRYLNVRALLFRKVLEHSLNQVAKPAILPDDMECSLPIGKAMMQSCTDSCVYTIAIIRRIAAKPQLLPAWWYTAYYVFNSALILFGTICLQTLGKTGDVGTKPAPELVASLRSGLEALELVGKETRIVRRCSKYLKKIIQVSTFLVRNHASAQQIPAEVSAMINSLPNGDPPSTSDGSTHSPLQTEFGQFLIDEDYSFLDVWSDLVVQEPMANMPNP